LSAIGSATADRPQLRVLQPVSRPRRGLGSHACRHRRRQEV